MFTPLAMQHVSLLVVREQASTAALTLARLGVFQPRIEQTPPPDLPELPARNYQRLITRASLHLDKLWKHYQLPASLPQDAAGDTPAEDEISALDNRLSALWQPCSVREERLRRLQESNKHLTHLQQSLQTFADLDIDLSLLHSRHSFLDLRVGTLPPEHQQQLSDALGLAGYRLVPFKQTESYLNAVLIGPADRSSQIKPALEFAGWQPLPVPEELRGHPEQMQAELKRQQQALQTELGQLDHERLRERGRLHEELAAAARSLALAQPYARLANALHSKGGLALVTGWVPELDLSRLQLGLQDSLHDNYHLHCRPPLAEERPEVPTACRHGRWLQPFVALVKNYGVPRYGEFDPTLLFALSYIAMFGMMFGDLGQGLLIAASAPLIGRRFPKVKPFVLLCGLSSALFGLLYGSVFGFEHLITPLWISPLTDPTYMLQVAMFSGVGFILLMTALTIRNRLIDGDLMSALLPGSGAAGLVLYLSLLWMAWAISSDGTAPWPAYLLFGASLSVIMTHSALENRGAPLVERLLIMLVEAFESLMSYVSGTLSFLRLAAFSLNHVALAIAVFTLAQMMDSTGYWITVVLGNVFILVLEGAIVMIQALRLEYYEGFSRFFSGQGREFRPLLLDNPQQHINT